MIKPLEEDLRNFIKIKVLKKRRKKSISKAFKKSSTSNKKKVTLIKRVLIYNTKKKERECEILKEKIVKLKLKNNFSCRSSNGA